MAEYVTSSELDKKLDEVKADVEKLPTRYEVRFLILAAFIASQLVPATDIAKAAIGAIP